MYSFAWFNPSSSAVGSNMIRKKSLERIVLLSSALREAGGLGAKAFGDYRR